MMMASSDIMVRTHDSIMTRHTLGLFQVTKDKWYVHDRRAVSGGKQHHKAKSSNFFYSDSYMDNQTRAHFTLLATCG